MSEAGRPWPRCSSRQGLLEKKQDSEVTHFTLLTSIMSVKSSRCRFNHEVHRPGLDVSIFPQGCSRDRVLGGRVRLGCLSPCGPQPRVHHGGPADACRVPGVTRAPPPPIPTNWTWGSRMRIPTGPGSEALWLHRLSGNLKAGLFSFGEEEVAGPGDISLVN